eukprot:3999493-Amphidinium_carterae.1
MEGARHLEPCPREHSPLPGFTPLSPGALPSPREHSFVAFFEIPKLVTARSPFSVFCWPTSSASLNVS